jgi:phage virion morphogenesis protein
MADLDLRHNGAEVAAFFNQLLQRTNDLSPVMRQIAGVLEDVPEESFATESAPDGTPWDDLSDYTKTERSERGYWPGQILQRSGRLAASIESDFDDNNASVGTTVIYAAIQHHGGMTSPNSMIPNKPIPARPFLGLGEQQEADIMGILREFLMSF